MDAKVHQSKLLPEDNKFHAGNGSAGKGTGRHIACFVLNPEVPND